MLQPKLPRKIVSKQSVKRGRFLPNFVANTSFFVFNVLIGLWYTPYLIDHLGTASYGIIPLVTTLTSYMVIITSSLNAAVSRYLTITLTRSQYDRANEYFNTSFFGSIMLAGILAIPVTFLALNLGSMISIPKGQVQSTQLLFVLAAAAFLINTIRTPFGVSTYYMNRFDLRNLLNVTQRLVTISFVVMAFHLTGPAIWKVGIGLVIGTTAVLLGDLFYWKKLTPELHLRLSRFKLSALRKITSIGGWISINEVGVILFLGIDLLVINKMFGAEPAGRYAAIMQWSILLRGMGGAISNIFGPTVVTLYAKKDTQAICQYLHRAIKCMGLLLALPVGLICGLAEPLLTVWLGPTFSDLGALMMLMTFHLSFNLSFRPLFAVQKAMNRLKAPTFVVLLIGVGNLGIAVLLAGPMGWGLYGVAAAGAISLTVKNALFSSLYVAHILGQNIGIFLKKIVPFAAVTCGVIVVCKLIAMRFNLADWFILFFVFSVISALYLLITYLVLLKPDEKSLLRKWICTALKLRPEARKR